MQVEVRGDALEDARAVEHRGAEPDGVGARAPQRHIALMPLALEKGPGRGPALVAAIDFSRALPLRVGSRALQAPAKLPTREHSMPSIFVFDAYGTLFDVHAAIGRFRAQAGPDAERMSEIWRSKQLEYTWTLTLAGHYVGFLDADRAGARLRAGARSLRRQGAEAELLGRLFQARRLSRRARGAARAQGQGRTRPASSPTARPTCSRARSKPPASAAISTPCSRSTR